MVPRRQLPRRQLPRRQRQRRKAPMSPSTGTADSAARLHAPRLLQRAPRSSSRGREVTTFTRWRARRRSTHAASRVPLKSRAAPRRVSSTPCRARRLSISLARLAPTARTARSSPSRSLVALVVVVALVVALAVALAVALVQTRTVRGSCRDSHLQACSRLHCSPRCYNRHTVKLLKTDLIQTHRDLIRWRNRKEHTLV